MTKTIRICIYTLEQLVNANGALMIKNMHRIICVAIGLVCANVSQGTTVSTTLSIIDHDMRPADWAVINKLSPVSISDSSFVNTEALSCVANAQFYSAIYRKTPVWTYAQYGGITNIALSADFFLDQNFPIFSPVLVQGQNVYAPPGAYYQQPGESGVSQGLSWSLPISLFGREIGTGPGVPDFSLGAPDIQFALAVRRDAGGARFRFGNISFTITGEKEVPDMLAGDYNEDGTVDASDYVVWRKTDGTPAGFNTWRANFGMTNGLGSASSTNANATVPEPATLLLLVVMAVGLGLRRRHFASVLPRNRWA